MRRLPDHNNRRSSTASGKSQAMERRLYRDGRPWSREHATLEETDKILRNTKGRVGVWERILSRCGRHVKLWYRLAARYVTQARRT